MMSVASVLLPGTDAGVAGQVVTSLIISVGLVVHLSRHDRGDAAWLVAGLSFMWFAFMGFRALH